MLHVQKTHFVLSRTDRFHRVRNLNSTEDTQVQEVAYYPSAEFMNPYFANIFFLHFFLNLIRSRLSKFLNNSLNLRHAVRLVVSKKKHHYCVSFLHIHCFVHSWQSCRFLQHRLTPF